MGNVLMLFPSLLALGLAVPSAYAQSPGSFLAVGNTLASAMMMFVVSPGKVYILDKVEGNAYQINNHPLYAAVWDIASRTATPIDVQTNAFCAAGMHLPNGSYALFGGNTAVGPGGNNSAPSSTTTFDPIYQDYDGTRTIRIFNPCDGNTPCSFNANSSQLIRHRWYPAAEPLADGTIAIIGGFVTGGYINRNYPNTDPEYEGGGAEPTYEFFPPRSQSPQVMNFMVKTSGLNSYASTYLMPSGKMFVQANYSTIIWDPATNAETPLPDMPGRIVRVYPASGANAMLPLTPANSYTPTILFCGGQYIDDYSWGNYSFPFANMWTIPASSDCHRITPEPTDGSSPAYVQDDSLPVGRTMGQFIALPDGTLLIVNGAQKGTAGYAERTLTVTSDAMPFGQSLATDPVFRPAIYNPNAPAGSRWSTVGLSSSNIPRLYHSSALLLPDGSVMIGGSNPNIDVNLTTIYPTTYTAEYFYPPYLGAKTRPVPENIPTVLSYGGNYFDITVGATSYSGAANDAADNTTIWLIRPGFTTHAMNMGQRALQLNHTYTVESNGTIILHTAQLPPNPALFQPGPAFLFVTISGIPSNGTYVVIGNGQVTNQLTAPASVLPQSVRNNQGSGSSNGGNNGTSINEAISTHPAGFLLSLCSVAGALALSLAWRIM